MYLSENLDLNRIGTGKSVSEALIFESVNPQYDERFFIESPQKYKFRTCCVQILFWMSKQTKKLRSIESFWVSVSTFKIK